MLKQTSQLRNCRIGATHHTKLSSGVPLPVSHVSNASRGLSAAANAATKAASITTAPTAAPARPGDVKHENQFKPEKLQQLQANSKPGNNADSSDDSDRRNSVRFGPSQELLMPREHSSEFDMMNICYDINNSGQGVDMQNLPSLNEQIERQQTWMTIYFRYRVNWYEAKAVLSKMPRDVAYRSNYLPLWTRCLKVQLHRKTIFLNAVRAFRNRMQCAMSGVRFMLNAFYRENDKKHGQNPNEAKPLPYFRCPDDLPGLSNMVVAELNVFVSNSTSYFDKFWDESMKEHLSQSLKST